MRVKNIPSRVALARAITSKLPGYGFLNMKMRLYAPKKGENGPNLKNPGRCLRKILNRYFLSLRNMSPRVSRARAITSKLPGHGFLNMKMRLYAPKKG